MNQSVFCKTVLNIQNWTTKNGARILFVEAHELPIVDIVVIFYAGSACDGKNFGLASFTSAMLKEGTKDLTARQVANAFDRIGAQFSIHTGIDTTAIYLRCLTETKVLTNALQTFTSVLTRPNFPQSEFSRTRGQILNAIQQKQQEPANIALDTFFKSLYGNSPYGHSILGTKDTITTIKLNNLRKFYQTHYVAKNAVVVVVGDITRKKVENMVNEVVSKLPSGSIINSPSEEIKKFGAKISRVNFSATQTNIVTGQIGVARDDINYFPLYVGNYILGQASLVSELQKEVREKRGLVYGIESDFYFLQKSGPFVINFGSSNEKSQEAFKAATSVLRNFVQNGPTAEQLKTAKASLIGKFPSEFASNALIRYKLIMLGVYRLPFDYFDTYAENIRAVTLKQVRTAFGRCINLDNMTTAIVGPIVQTKK